MTIAGSTFAHYKMCKSENIYYISFVDFSPTLLYCSRVEGKRNLDVKENRTYNLLLVV